MKTLPKFYNDLDEIEREIYNLLIQGVKKRKSNFHNAVLGSVSYDNKPEIRTVVLRDFSQKNLNIKIHSDLRSKKIKELEKNNNISLLFYDEKKKIQIRVRGLARIHKSYEPSWTKLSNWSKRCYLTSKAPGEESSDPTSGFPEKFSQDAPQNHESKKAIKNFSVIEIELNQIEWLFLASQGHRRAIFNVIRQEKNIYLEKKWLVP
tara:strand:+ start:877 stop:1494 length:618 start_codon:yes stop_codon:yes gene_type:complete